MTAAALEGEMKVGSVLDGKYCIERVVGQGGMGMVFAASHLQLRQLVALKFLLPTATKDASLLERFVREGRASAQLRSEHVCRVSDVGVLDNGTPYIVMELLEGRDLASLVPVPVSQAADYVLQACVGIAEAHALGIVHRDLKPANLFLTHRSDGSPLIKVLDFGIAKSHSDGDLSLTTTATFIGSPAYMAPEHLRSARFADARSDIWSLGVILFELVSGHPPFTGESITDLAFKVAIDPTPPLDVAGLAPGFEAVVNRCLEKDPAHRFPNLRELAHALAPFGGREAPVFAAAVSRVLNLRDDQVPAATSRPPPPDRAPAADTSVRTVSSPPTRMPIASGETMLASRAPSVTPVVHSAEPVRRKRWPWLAAAAGGAIAVIVGVVLAGGGSNEQAGPRAVVPEARPEARPEAKPADPTAGARPPDVARGDDIGAVTGPDAAATTTTGSDPETPTRTHRPQKPPRNRHDTSRTATETTPPAAIKPGTGSAATRPRTGSAAPLPF